MPLDTKDYAGGGPTSGAVMLDEATFGVALDAFRPRDILRAPGSGNMVSPKCMFCDRHLHPVRSNDAGDTYLECLTDHNPGDPTAPGYEAIFRAATRTFEPPLQWVAPGLPWRPPVGFGVPTVQQFSESLCQAIHAAGLTVADYHARLVKFSGGAGPRVKGLRGAAAAAAAAPRAEAVAHVTPAVSQETLDALTVMGITVEEYLERLRAAAGPPAAAVPPAAPAAAPRRRGAPKATRKAPATAKATPAPAQELLSLHAAARLSGISRSTLRYQAEHGGIPGAIKTAEGWRFPAAGVLELKAKREAGQ